MDFAAFLQPAIKTYIDQLSAHDDPVLFRMGVAIEALHQTTGLFALIYMDIDKHLSPDAFPSIREKLPAGGVLIVDNMLWFGRVVDKNDTSASTEGIRRFTRALWA